MSVTNPIEVEQESIERTPAAGAAIRQTSLWKDAYYRFRANKAAVVAAVMFLLMCLYVIVVPFVSPYDPYAVDFAHAYLLPTWSHPLGTDQYGRDLMTRVALGGRVSIGIGFVGTFV